MSRRGGWDANPGEGSTIIPSKINSYVLKIVLEPDEFEDGRGAWHASCPALNGCHTWGYSYEDALANIREAIDLYVQDLFEAGESILR